jgi:2-C-methyl-D-erythritol 4-phosphate cytidylyltransferase
MMKFYAIVLAGGSGQRMGVEGNKVFLTLRGIPAIVRAIAPFSSLCQGILVVARADELDLMREVLRQYGLAKLVTDVVAGGEDRQASVAQGLAALPKDAQGVLIHDGARALVTEGVIQTVIESVREHGSGVAAIPVIDTIKRADGAGFVQETLARESLFAMQTPQGFTVQALLEAHAKADGAGYRATDDGALLEYAGLPVRLCQGDPENIKLTTAMDMVLADMILSRRAQQE